ncbi:chemotaxis protein CheB [Crateriforma spongiae]|uniref:chemotaxis protein CheB n=1 Tax=Crateriforma spongiae TaxID=2724528 RepID=UPI001447970B|nr:chemotaxis protein CheB [Crateriforma spongiae]
MNARSADSPTYVVGIGASAGGLEALERFFGLMKPDTGMAFVVVQHLSPDFKSLMDELLARWTSMSINRVEDRMEVRPNSIYLIPPKKEMIISDGKLLLTDKDPSQSLTLPIDHFMRSLAHEMGHRAVAVILSGTGSDGSRGIEEIHNCGGMVICQSEDSAKFDGMPRSALDTGLVDLVLPPDEIPQALQHYIENPDPAEVARSMLKETAVQDDDIGGLFKLLRDAYGIDFSYYKVSTVTRRIERRLALKSVNSLSDYVKWLMEDPGELNALYKDLLIGVTQFFRDGEAFERLSDQITPLLENLNPGEEFRVWVSGCGTGEEAYSLAILIHQQLKAIDRNLNVKIFATDVHQDSLHHASQGIYHESALADMFAEHRDEYFVKTRDGYQIIPEIRQWVVFAPHNLIKDAPFTKIDLVTCRNLLIYFQNPAQKKAISMFHFALKTGGVLFLGPSESIGELADEFDTLESYWKLYRKRRDVRLPTEGALPLGSTEGFRNPNAGVSATPRMRGTDESLIGIYDNLLNHYIPHGILVDESRRLLHVFGNGGDFMRYRPGRPSRDVLDSLPPELRTAVSAAFHRATRENNPITFRGVPVTLPDGEDRLATVVIRPIETAQKRPPAYLISVEVSENQPAVIVEPDSNLDMASASSEQVARLETELRYARENLQATIEELETSNEELQATNEELVASNEELQSTNEELHSVNEELYTVNAEHQTKISELTEITRDMDNLLLSTDLHTIFLDRNLCIRKFTPKIGETFSFLKQDIGRRIDSFTYKLQHENLVEHAEQVLKTQQPLSFETQDLNGTWFMLRILPYRSGADIDGVVLTLTDICSLKDANSALKESVRRRDEFLAMLSHELRNPLAAILNATYLMDQSDTTTMDQSNAYQVVQRQTKQMATLMNDLLDVARVTQGKIELQNDLVDLRDTIPPTLETIDGYIKQHQQTLVCNVADEPILIWGSQARIQQIQVNLLTNASKYTHDGGEIRLSVGKEDDNAIIRVSDNGVGIPPELLESIFELFVQSEATLDRAQGGMGVGLTLVKSLVDLHDGKVSVHSDGTGQGSEFVVRLPLAKNQLQKPLQPAPQPGPRPVGNRVVLIEDNPDAAEMLASLLELEGLEVVTADNGCAGLEQIRQYQPDVALVDIGLPELDGYEIARVTRSDQQLGGTRMIALTGYGQSEDRKKALESGFDDHLVKPIEPDRLFDVLRPFVRLRD